MQYEIQFLIVTETSITVQNSSWLSNPILRLNYEQGSNNNNLCLFKNSLTMCIGHNISNHFTKLTHL